MLLPKVLIIEIQAMLTINKRSPFKKRFMIACAAVMLCVVNTGFAEQTLVNPATPAPNKSILSSNKIVAVPSNMPKQIEIGVAVVVNKINKIDEKNDTFDADVDITYSWNDPTQIFDPKILGSTRKEYSREVASAKIQKMWSPHIDISNIIGKPASLERGIWIYSDGQVVYNQHIVGTFHSKFNLKAFPFDRQALAINLDSTRYTSDELQFTQNQKEVNASGIREGASLAGWDLDELVFVPSQVQGWEGSFYPQFSAQVIMQRIAPSYLFDFLPLLLIMLMPLLLTLYLKSDVGPRLSAWAGALLATVATSFTLNLRYPALDSDSIVSQILVICFGFQFLMICLTMTVFNAQLTDKIKNQHLLAEIIRFLRWSIPIGFVLVLLSRILLTAFS
jgi:hypothetical protein